jgi:hypothetical protein
MISDEGGGEEFKIKDILTADRGSAAFNDLISP